MKATESISFNTLGVYVNEIEFRTKEEVYLFGFIQDCGQFVETQYIISRKDLQILLSRNKRAGIEILWKIERLFVLPHEVPASLNLIDLFGTTQVFEAKDFTGYALPDSYGCAPNKVITLTSAH